ncbi:MAG: hypothetical protein HRT58_21590 [Crocinitomicaceae bacterium]|nr:ATP-binding protein [Flavobacteriales bacterium]NQZ38268.1 hypothetical protein [Crocinitomicaceae bacterium]
MKIKCSFLACLIFLPFMSSFSQGVDNKELDSLILVYSNTKLHDTVRINAMDDACSKLIRTNPERAFPVVQRMLKSAGKIKGLKWKARANYQLGLYYAYIGKSDSARHFGHRSRTMYVNADNNLGQSNAANLIANTYYSGDPDSALFYYRESVELDNNAVVYLNMALIHKTKGNFPLALSLIKEALALLKINHDAAVESFAYGVIASTHYSLYDFDQAEIYYLKQLKLIEKVNDSQGFISVYTNLARLYFDKDDSKQSNVYLAKLLKISKKVNSDHGMASYYETKSRTLLSDGQFEEAKAHAELAIEKYTNVEGEGNVSFMLGILGKAEIGSKQYQLAIKHCTEGLELATINERIGGQELACDCLSESYKALGQYENALKFYVLNTKYKDSTYNIENAQKSAQQGMQYDFDKKQLADSLEIVEQNRQTEIEHITDLEKEKRFRIILFAIVGVLFLFILFGYRENRRKKKQAVVLNEKNELINKSLHEKEVLLKEIHHRVKNNFQTVSSLLKLQSKNVVDKEALRTISEGQNRIKAMSLIHQKLYQNETISAVSFQEYTEQLIKQITSLFSLRELEIEVQANDIELDIDTSIPLGLILNELITNACKYGLCSRDKGKLTVVINKPTGELYKLTVQDSGKGIPKDMDFSNIKSLGLRLVQQLTKQLHGSFNYQYVNGSLFEVTFRDTAYRKEID